MDSPQLPVRLSWARACAALGLFVLPALAVLIPKGFLPFGLLLLVSSLLIADYLLPEQRTGIEVIHLMRTRFGSDLPVIMITGSTMNGHEDQALNENFHLLLKPVIPTRLRALIAFKLGQH